MAQPSRQVKILSRYGKPAHLDAVPDDQASIQVRFRHPAYPDAENILFSFPALDDGGVHYGTAHTACAVLADFRFDGYFSRTAAGPAIDCGPDDILTETNYYFHVPHDQKYNIVANFASCIFPHGNMPPLWLSDHLTISEAVDLPRETSCNNIALSRDISCRVTNCTLGTEGAHLIPKSEELWHVKNAMSQYSAWQEKGTTDDPRNIILLRSDVHTLFDAKRLLIVPKRGKWVTHVLYGAARDELKRCFHNIHVQPLTGVAVEFLFARFLYTIHALSTFTAFGAAKRALLVIKSGQESRERVDVTALQYRTELAPRPRGGSRTPSPSKRRRDDAMTDTAELWDSNSEDDREPRGRPVRRRLAYYTTTSPPSLSSCSSISALDNDPSEPDRVSSLSTIQQPPASKPLHGENTSVDW